MSHTPCSIVITCYNLERYIGEAIRSVLGQEQLDEVDIVVVDDCSTDDSASIIHAFPSVRYLRTPRNSGVLLAMLQGIEAAENDIIFLLDGDDLWEPEKLRLARAAFSADATLGLLTHDLCFIDAEGRPIKRTSRPAQKLGSVSRTEISDAVRHGILALTDYVWLGSALAFRRSLVDIVGFDAWIRTLPDPRNIYQDWPLAYWVAARPSTKLGYLDVKLFRYRLHGANHSGDARSGEKALRNVRRTLNTTEAMLAIARKDGVAIRYRRIVERQRTFYRYLVSLYGDRRFAAGAWLARSLPYLAANPTLFGKEAVRFGLIVMIGTRRFTAWRLARSK